MTTPTSNPTNTATQFTYLVAYTFNNARHTDRLLVTVPAPLLSLADVESVQGNLRRSNRYLRDALVVAFSLLPGEDSAAATEAAS
jgi:hypothetical protein